MSVLKPRPPSEAGTDSSWEMDGRRWLNKRAQSEPGGDTTGTMSSENLKRMQHESGQEERAGHRSSDTTEPEVAAERGHSNEQDPRPVAVERPDHRGGQGGVREGSAG